MSETKLYGIFKNKLEFDIGDFLTEEVTELQKEIIEEATFILKENIIEEVESWGGNIKKNEEKFNELMKHAEEELEDEKYKEIKKSLKDYVKKLKEVILKNCVAIIPVKELPWIDVVFRTVPRIVQQEGKIQLIDKTIAYYGEIKCVLSRPILYGKIKGEEPLFAPYSGNLDLGGFKHDESFEGPKSKNVAYIDAVLNSFDSTISKSQVGKYHEGYQRHGDPICDYLMKDDELLKSMEAVKSGQDSGRVQSDIVICAIAVPHPSDKTTLVLVSDEGEDQARFGRCFEALLKFSAACCQLPSTGPTPVASTGQQAQQQGQPTGAVTTPGGQELKTWTAEELVEQAQKRLQSQPEMQVWTEEELNKMAEDRGSGIPEGMEIWTEEDLQELAEKRRAGGLNIPEWKPEDSLSECGECGYSLRPGWSKCPVCETPVGTTTTKDDDKPDEVESESASEDQPEDTTPEESLEKPDDNPPG